MWLRTLRRSIVDAFFWLMVLVFYAVAFLGFYTYFFPSHRYPPFTELVTVQGVVQRIEETDSRYSRLEVELRGTQATFLYPLDIIGGSSEAIIASAPRGSSVTLWVDKNDHQKGGSVDIYQMHQGSKEIVSYAEVVRAFNADSAWAWLGGLFMLVGAVVMTIVGVRSDN